MKTLFVTCAVGALIAAAPSLAQIQPQSQAQGPATGGARGAWGQRDQTRAEAKQRADMLFQMLDTNRDGTVTREEADQALAQLQASQGSGDENGRGGGRGRMLQRVIERLFATATSISQQQLETLMLARFDAQDLNHDGTVTAAEREQARERQRQGGATPAPAVAPNTTPQ